jgi:fatty-acyl-CoA synthase
VTPDDEFDAISLNYTSGTTGNPKGVVCHHRGAYLTSMINVVEWNMPLYSKMLWVVPMFHCNGWNFPWTMAAVAGTNYFLRQIRPAQMFDIIERHQVQYFAGAPVTMNTLLAHPQKFKFKHQVKCWVAGAPPPPAVIRRFEAEIGVNVQCAYGLTETYGPMGTHNVDPDWLLTHPSAEELLIKRTFLTADGTVEDFRVLCPETMTEVPADGVTVGEVMIRGNIVMKGYLGNEKATKEAFEGGWFHSGDLAVSHGNGRIELKDRSKDIIISGGENISSIQVENHLLDHEWVGEVAVVAMADEKWGEVPLAFVVPRPGLGVTIVLSDSVKNADGSMVAHDALHGQSLNHPDGKTLTAADFMAWSRTKMAGYETPKKIVFIDSLPKTSTGKTQKHILRSMIDLYTKERVME